MVRAYLVAAVVLAVCPLVAQDAKKFGHSHLGSAFDSGLRTKPWKFMGIGSAPFPISSKVPEVQSWYNQGNALLHSFWFEEAERSFRWCLKLDPENAMIYFGLARCGLNSFNLEFQDSPQLPRFREFLKEAVRRKHTVTERERMYIEAWDAAWKKSGKEAVEELVRQLTSICLKFPDDLEAKSQLAFYNMALGSPLATEQLVRKVLAVAPKHPGAHHARIHLWDGEHGDQALQSCEVYGNIAPSIGHAWHMPGHIYSGVGMWHEAAIAMDSATRVELRHMNERMAFPFENWNYPHNRDYLCFIQEQLGRFEASLQGSRDLMAVPSDPTYPGMQYPALMPFTRALIKFERWDKILDNATWPTNLDPMWMPFKNSAQIMAYAATGEPAKGRTLLDQMSKGIEFMLKMEIAKMPDQADKLRADMEANMPSIFRVGEAQLLLAEGKRAEGLKLLKEMVGKEALSRSAEKYPNDPPVDPWPAARLLGDAYFAGGEYGEAIWAYEQSLAAVRNDAWSLGGLAKAHYARGEKAQAGEYAARFFAVWRDADPGLKLMREMQALNLKVTPKSVTPRPERRYNPAALDKLGPSNWQPFPAPELDCLDINGKRVRLSDFRGKNVLLVFYLSDQCVHCVDQLGAINKRMTEFEAANTVVLGVSSTSSADNKTSVQLAPFSVKLLSDTKHENARRFASYDDFEEMELHSTTLIDAQGRVRWKKSGGEPFQDVSFLLNEIKRWK